MSKEKWVALPAVQDATGSEITLGYTGLPVSFDTEQLQLNVDTLRRGVIGWGGFSALTLAAYHGDADKYEVGVAGSDANGSAYGTSAVSMAKAESSTMQSVSEAEPNASDIRSGRLGIQWNIAALNGRIAAHEQFDPAVRARQLSREIRSSSIKGVLRHNTVDRIKDDTPWGNILRGFFDTVHISSIAQSVITKDWGSAIRSLCFRVALLQGVVRGVKSLDPGITYRDTLDDLLFLSMRPTRAAIGAGLLATSRLVRPTPLA